MSRFDQKQFNTFLLENKIVGFFPEAITLKSGRKSNWYVNWRTVVEDAFLTKQLAQFVIDFSEDLISSDSIPKIESFYGVPEGATKLGIITQYEYAQANTSFSDGSHVLSMGRAKPKEHGIAKDKYFLGVPRGTTVVLEDVTTTGGSLLSTLEQLKQSEINVVAAIGLTNRMELRDDRKSVREAVAELGVPYFNMSSAVEVLPLVYREQSPGEAIGAAIEQEFKEYGEEPLALRS